jgi:hypothetical protein
MSDELIQDISAILPSQKPFFMHFPNDKNVIAIFVAYAAETPGNRCGHQGVDHFCFNSSSPFISSVLQLQLSLT